MRVFFVCFQTHSKHSTNNKKSSGAHRCQRQGSTMSMHSLTIQQAKKLGKKDILEFDLAELKQFQDESDLILLGTKWNGL